MTALLRILDRLTLVIWAGIVVLFAALLLGTLLLLLAAI